VAWGKILSSKFQVPIYNPLLRLNQSSIIGFGIFGQVFQPFQ